MAPTKPSALERIQRLEAAEQARLEREERKRRHRTGRLEEVASTTPRRDRIESIEHVMRYPMAVIGLGWLGCVIAVLSLNLHGAAPDVLVTTLFILWVVVFVEYIVRLFAVDDRKGYVSARLVEPAVVVVPAFQYLRLFGLDRVTVVVLEVVLRIRAILVHRGLLRVLIAATGLLFLGAWLEVLFETNAKGSNIHTYGDSLWWAIVTVTTVGYGDRYPVTLGGRLVAVVLMLVGIGLLGVLTASVASFFVAEHADDNKAELKESHAQLGTQVDALAAQVAQLQVQLAGSGGGPAAPDPDGGGAPSP